MSILLLLVVCFPVIYNITFLKKPKVLLSNFVFLGPLLILWLTAYTHFFSTNLEFLIFSVRDYQNVYATFGLTLDTLSGVIATTVLTIGCVVSRFSFRYLEDDPARKKFLLNLSMVISSVLVMLMSHNMIQYLGAWILTSYFLHQLLLHFDQREKAVKAAKKKFWVTRWGDLCFFCALSILFYVFQTLDLALIFEKIGNPEFIANHSFELNTVATLLIVGAMTQSVLLPFHSWLPETMEAPTPVSALMHAGIINAGGYLMIRMSPLLAKTPTPMLFLVIISTITIVYAALVMITQTNVKKNLAYSTIAQMGFMMLQCGLGAYAFATLHIVGHAFYKAYMFLTSATATDSGKMSRYFPSQLKQYPLIFQAVLALVMVGTVFSVSFLINNELFKNIGAVSLLFVFSLALAQIILVAKNKTMSLMTIGAIVALYLLLSQMISKSIRFVELDVSSLPYLVYASLFAFVSLSFLGLYFFQNNLYRINQTTWGQKLYVSFYSDFFKKGHSSLGG